MSERNAGAVKQWAEDVAMRLLDDLGFDADAWDSVFDWVVENVRVGESYSSILRKAMREVIASRVAARFAKQKDDVPPDFQGDPRTHGIDEPRGGGFSIMQNLQKDLVKEEDEDEGEKKDKKAAGVFSAAVREAMYWGGRGRTYRLTRHEQNGGDVVCPRCGGCMGQERFTKSEKMYRCPECGFMVPSGKVVTQRVEVEVEPDGGVEVEVTNAALRRVARNFHNVYLRDYLQPGGKHPYKALPRHLEDIRRAGKDVSLISVPGFLMLSGFADDEELGGRPWLKDGKWYENAKDALNERGGKR